MSFAKCFDVVKMVTDEATVQFGSLLRVDKEREDSLNLCCRMIDNIAKRFNGVSYEADVNDITTDITVSLVCDGFEIDNTSDDEFYVLAAQAKQLKFKQCDTDALQMDFVFGGIWTKAC